MRQTFKYKGSESWEYPPSGIWKKKSFALDCCSYNNGVKKNYTSDQGLVIPTNLYFVNAKLFRCGDAKLI